MTDTSITNSATNDSNNAAPYGWDCIPAGAEGTSLEHEIKRSKRRVNVIANSMLSLSVAFMFMFGWELAAAGPSVFTLFPLVASLMMWQVSRTLRDV